MNKERERNSNEEEVGGAANTTPLELSASLLYIKNRAEPCLLRSDKLFFTIAL